MIYPEVEKLTNAIQRKGIDVHALPVDEALKSIFYRYVLLTINHQQFTFPVNDEYEYVDENNPVVLLHMI